MACDVMRGRALGLSAVAAAVMCCALLLPAAKDRLGLSAVARAAATPGGVVAGFDFGSFIQDLVPRVRQFAQDATVFQDAITGAIEKATGSAKEASQAGVNYKAAKEAVEAARGAQDLTAMDLPDSCQIAAEKRENVKAQGDAAMQARAMTVLMVRQDAAQRGPERGQGLLRAANADYCSPEAAQRGRCTTVSPKNMPDADINAATLLGTADGSTETLGADEYEAAQKYVSWATNPSPDPALPITTERSDRGVAYLVAQRRQLAIMSAAQYSMNMAIAARRARD